MGIDSDAPLRSMVADRGFPEGALRQKSRTRTRPSKPRSSDQMPAVLYFALMAIITASSDIHGRPPRMLRTPPVCRSICE